MTTPATVVTKSLIQASKALKAQTTYTIEYTTINAMEAGAALKIFYPAGVTVSTLSSCELTYNSKFIHKFLMILI